MNAPVGSISTIGHSLTVFRKHPSPLLPLLAVWCVYAPLVIYLKFKFPLTGASTSTAIAVVFAAVCLLSVALASSCLVLIEMLKQLSAGTRPSAVRALRDGILGDFFAVLPIAIVWAIIWCALLLIEAILAKKRDRDDGDQLTVESAAETLAGFHSLSFSEAFFQALEKGVRMIVFLIIPSVVWEGLGPVAATKKGLGVLRAHLGEFVAAYGSSYAFAVMIFLPAAILIWLGSPSHGHAPIMHFSNGMWMALMLYCAFAWSLNMYVEQMLAANLYLWHLSWESAAEMARANGQRVPSLYEVTPPHLLTILPELAGLSSVVGAS